MLHPLDQRRRLQRTHQQQPHLCRTRENMNEFKVCGLWASQLRKSLLPISHLHTGYYFAETVALAKSIQKHDDLNLRGTGHSSPAVTPSCSPPSTSTARTPSNASSRHFITYSYRPTNRPSRSPCPASNPSPGSAGPRRSTRSDSRSSSPSCPDFTWNEADKKYNPVVRDLELLTQSTTTPWRPNDTETTDITLQASFAVTGTADPRHNGNSGPRRRSLVSERRFKRIRALHLRNHEDRAMLRVIPSP